MKWTVPLLLLFFSITTKAQESISYFTINNKEEAFINFPAQHLTLSRNCGKQLKSMQCDAYKNLQLLKKQPLNNKVGINPGVILCVKQLKGKLVTGTNKYGDNSFCLFNDGSMIDAGSLTYYFFHPRK